ncbi:MAG: hypothetical protein ACXV3F_13340, partial [Frankiaceae bacterium]
RDRFDPDDLDPLDPFELDEANIPHLHKHGFTTDDLYDIWVDPDAIYAPARPDGFADWLLIGADRLNLSMVPPERVRELAGWARRSTPRALRRLDSDRRYPVLLAAAATTCTEIVDEVVRLFDQALAAVDGRARRQVAEQRAAVVKGDYERLRLLDEILDIVLDDGLDDAAVGANLRHLGRDRLAGAARPPDERPPADGGHLALLEARHSYLRQFAPHVLAAIEFSASVEASEVLNAVTLLRRLNAEGRRTVPDDAPTGFVPARWQPYLDAAHAAGKTAEYRHYWELAVLFALQGALRSGEIWVEGSRRYANPASYLIPPERWQDIRADTPVRTRAPTRFADRLAALEAELEGHLAELETGVWGTTERRLATPDPGAWRG